MRFRVLVLLSVALASPAAWGDHKALVENMVRPLLDADAIVGCVVGVIDNGKHEVYGFGETRRGDKESPSGDTIYEIGSMTKTFTGTLLADMVNRGLVKLDAPLQDFMPAGVTLHEVPDHPIRLVDVASQSSGLPRMPDNFTPKDPKNPYVDYTPEQMFAFLGKHELRRPPGEYEYSNLGMGMLGYLLSKQAGKSYEELAIEGICEPLKMNDTRITLSDEQRKRLAPPYNADLGPEHNWDFDALAGAGAIRSTANDMLKLVDASLSDDDCPVVAAIHKAWEKHYGKPGEIGVALGWHIARDGVTMWHNGQTGGYSSVVYIYPPKKMAVVVLCNTATQVTTSLGEKILQSMLGMTPAPVDVRKAIEVDPEVLKSYEGTYGVAPMMMITVTVENGKLMAQLTGQDKFQLYAKSETEFFYRIVDAQISFEKGEGGKVEKLILHQNGLDLPAARLKAE